MNIKSKKYRFSLIEVLVALCIISICFTVYMQALRVNIDNTAVSQSYITACLLANKKLAKLSSDKKLKIEEKKGEFGDNYPAFKWKLKVDEFTNDDKKRLFKTKLEILFNRNGQERTITFHSLAINHKAFKKQDSEKDSSSGNKQETQNKTGNS